MPDKKLRKPLKRTEVKRWKPFSITRKEKKIRKEISKVKSGIKRTALIGILDSVFSKYVRMKHADERGFVSCFTCPEKLPFAQMQNGHFISRRNMSTRYELKNCKPQCHQCNMYKRGNIKVFEARLGDEWVAEVVALSRIPRKWTADELQEQINHYRKLIAELK